MKILHFYLLIFLSLTHLNSLEISDKHLCVELANKFKTNTVLDDAITNNFNSLKDDSKYCIEYFLRTSKYEALETYITLLNKEGIKFRETLKNAFNNIEKEITDIYNKYRFKESDYHIVSPAFQWSQSLSDVFIELKFSHKFDSPGCLEVENINLNVNSNKLIFSAKCVLDEIPIKFELNIECLHNFDEHQVNHSSRAVGRYQITIKKSKAEYWERLLFDPKKIIINMKPWLEMNNKYSEELKQYINDTKSVDDENKSFDDIKREILEEKRRLKLERKKNKMKKKKNEDL